MMVDVSLSKNDVSGIVLALMNLPYSMKSGGLDIEIPAIITSDNTYSITGVKYITAFYDEPVFELYTLIECGEIGKLIFSSDMLLLKYVQL